MIGQGAVLVADGLLCRTPIGIQYGCNGSTEFQGLFTLLLSCNNGRYEHQGSSISDFGLGLPSATLEHARLCALGRHRRGVGRDPLLVGLLPPGCPRLPAGPRSGTAA